ncbi:MAG: DUF2851 family protein [Chthoniobacterales bacterium]
MSLTLLDGYRRAIEAGGSAIREDAADFAAMPELEWQARWFAGEFGNAWTSVDGTPVHLVDFGRWNREPGPDFVDARLRIGDREVRGAIELDRDARDWEHHGHATNPAFRDVVLHVFIEQPARRFFTRTIEHREVTQVQLCAKRPHTRRSRAEYPTRFHVSETSVLLAAARHRLDLKARALQRYAGVHGEGEAWFAALAMALGYKQNQTPFLLLAQRVGLRAAGGPEGEALLFGTAGFLESPAPPEADRAVRAYLRDLWENWWTHRASCERWILPRKAWHSGGARPANHPHRRVATLARIAAGWSPIRKALTQSRRDALVAALESIAHPFWTMRFNLRGDELAKTQSLLGAERIRDIIINIHHPLAIARDDGAWPAFLREKGPAPAAIIRNAAARFFGASEISLSSAAIQQGLLQLERDFRAAPEPADFLGALRKLATDSTGGDGAC